MKQLDCGHVGWQVPRIVPAIIVLVVATLAAKWWTMCHQGSRPDPADHGLADRLDRLTPWGTMESCQ